MISQHNRSKNHLGNLHKRSKERPGIKTFYVCFCFNQSSPGLYYRQLWLRCAGLGQERQAELPTPTLLFSFSSTDFHKLNLKRPDMLKATP